MMEDVRDAAEALRRQRFVERVVEEIDTLRADRSAWSDYIGEADSTDVSDGLH